MENVTMKTTKKWSKLLTNLVVDLVFLVAFLASIEVKGTGLVIHEWLGVGILAFILVHVLLHWNWVTAVTKKFFRKLVAEPRLNYIVDLLIFIAFITIIFSGLVISRVVLPAIGLEGLRSGFWKVLHAQATNLTIILTGIHLGLHWKWFVSMFRKYVSTPLHMRKANKQVVESPVTVTVDAE